MLPLALAALTALFLTAAIYWLAGRRPDYSHWRPTLSELGEVGAPDQRLARGFTTSAERSSTSATLCP